MTAVLTEMRRIEAAVRRGDMTRTQQAMAKARLMESIETVELAPEPETRPAPGFVLWHVLALVGGIFALGTFAMGLLFGDTTLALTVCVTVMAVATVRAFRTLD